MCVCALSCQTPALYRQMITHWIFSKDFYMLYFSLLPHPCSGGTTAEKSDSLQSCSNGKPFTNKYIKHNLIALFLTHLYVIDFVSVNIFQYLN